MSYNTQNLVQSWKKNPVEVALDISATLHKFGKTFVLKIHRQIPVSTQETRFFQLSLQTKPYSKLAIKALRKAMKKVQSSNTISDLLCTFNY